MSPKVLEVTYSQVVSQILFALLSDQPVSDIIMRGAGVFDGHAGDFVSQYLAEQMYEKLSNGSKSVAVQCKQ